MNGYRQMMRRVVVLLTLLLAITAALPMAGTAKPEDNGGPGNSGAAKLCQDGGWRVLGPAGAAVGFASEEECVSYGAQGGEIAALTGFVIPAGATATFTGTLGACNQISGSWATSDGSSGSLGQLSRALNSFECGQGVPNGATISETVGPFATAVVITSVSLTDITCGHTYSWTSNHALITGNQVDITDSGWSFSRCDQTGPRVPAPGGGNLSVAIDIS